jgi:transcriptional regulator of heat shock response
LQDENPFIVWGSPDVVRDFLFVEDVIHAALLILEKGEPMRPYNVGSGEAITVGQIVESILKSTQKNPEVVWDNSSIPLRNVDCLSDENISKLENEICLMEDPVATDAERIQQHVVLLASDVSEQSLVSLKEKFNQVCSGKAIESLSESLKVLVTKFAPEQRVNVQILVDGILLLIDANKQDKVAFAGAANLVRSEQQFAGGLSSLLHTFDEQSDIWQFLNLWKLEAEKPRAIIGSENSVFELSTSSLLLSSYSNQGTEVAKVAVVGPTRMNYPRNFAAVLAVSKLLSKDQED